MCKRNINLLPLALPQLGSRPATQACALTGDLTSNLRICRLALSPLSHTSIIFFIHTFGYFPVWSVMNTVAVNIHVQDFVWTCVFISLGHMPKNGISWLYGNFVYFGLCLIFKELWPDI